MLKKEKKSLFILGLLIAAIVLVMFSPILLNHVPLTYGTDIKPQWFEFYTEFEALIKNFLDTRTLPFYSWNLFLGNNFYASKSYYLLGDIFSYLGLLFNQQFFDMAFLLEIIKMFTAGYTMYFLLSSFDMKPPVKIAGAIAYTFSSWAIFFSGQLSFLSFYCLMPLYFLGIEGYLKKGKKILFIIMCAWLLFTNFYFFYTLSCFTPVYYLYRYSLVKKDWARLFKDTAGILFLYLIGCAITGILTLPTVYYILGNDRVGQFYAQPLWNQVKIYLHEIIAALVPNYLYIYSNNIFETGWHATRELCLWSGSLFALLLPQIFFDKDKRYQRATVAVYLVFLLVLFLPFLDSAVHGFSDPSFRWTMIIILFNILTASRYLNDLNKVNICALRKTLICGTLILLLIIPVTAIFTGELNTVFQTYWQQIALFSSCAGVLIINGLALIHWQKCRHTQKLLLLVLCAELALSGFLLFVPRGDFSESDSYDFIQSVTHVLQSEKNELNDFLNQIEPSNSSEYYRVYIPHDSIYWSYSHNMSVFYQLNGTMTYDSTYAPSFNKMKELAPQVTEFESEWIFNIKDKDILNFLSVKYAIVTRSEELPSGMSWRLMTDNYRGLSVYRNDEYRAFGTTRTEVKTYEQYEDEHLSLSALNDIVLCELDDFNTILDNVRYENEAQLENIEYYGNQLSGTCWTEAGSFMVTSLPFDEGWNVLVNGSHTKAYKVNGGFIGFSVPAGDSFVEMYFTPKGFKQGAIITGIGLVMLLFVILGELRDRRRRNRHA